MNLDDEDYIEEEPKPMQAAAQLKEGTLKASGMETALGWVYVSSQSLAINVYYQKTDLDSKY